MVRSSSLYRVQGGSEPVRSALVHAAPIGQQDLPCATARPIVVMDDGGEAALHAARRAELIARSWGVPVHRVSTPASSWRPMPTQECRLDAAALLVTHVRDDWKPSEWILGNHAEQLVRRCSVPVLVVRQPAARPYRRVLVAVKLEPLATELVARARMLAPSGARLDVVHVLGTSDEFGLRIADVPEAAVRARRAHVQRDANRRVDDLVAAACDRNANPVASVVFVGSAPDRLVQMSRAARAELIVLGKRPRHWLADFFLDRGIARRVLGEGHGDVLLVPGPPWPGAAPGCARGRNAVAGVRSTRSGGRR